MSILSTSSKLVRVGDSYSAGEGISIENNTISVTGDYGHAYSAGDNITISDNHIISSKDWSSDIDTAVQNVSAETTAWVDSQNYLTDADMSDYALITDVETTSGLLKMDIDTVSASITGKMDSTAFNDWQNGQYANDIAGLANNIDTVSGAVDDISATIEGLDIPTHQEIENASGYAYSQSTAWCDSQGYLKEHQPISADEWNDSYETVLANSAQWSENTGDEDVNNAVYNNSAKWNEIEVYQTNSSTYLTAHQDISNKLDTTAFSTVSGTFLTAHQSLDGYLTKTSADTLYQPIGSYATRNELVEVADYASRVSGDLKSDIDYISGVAITALPSDLVSTGDLNTASSFLSAAINDVSGQIPVIPDMSATEWNSVYDSVESNSGLWNEMTAYQNASGTFLTAHQSLDNYYTKSETSGADELANAFANIPAGDAEVNAYVQGNSATIDNVSTTVQTNSAQWAEGTSVDTVPVAVISPLVTGFSGESAYLGIESTALNLSSYVPVSAIGVNSQGYVSGISGKNISARYAMTAYYANNAGNANRATYDSNSNTITSYYQPKLTISGDAGTITSINGSAVGASIPEGWELVAGQGIEIVDDAENNQTTISVTAAGGNPEVESYVQTNSASIDDAVSTYQTNSGTFLTAHQTIPSAKWEDASDCVQTNSAQWGQGGAGDEEVNSFVHNNSATINEVNTTYQANSGSYQPSGNYIPYTAVNTSINPTFRTNSGLEINTNANGGLNSTFMSPSTIQLRYAGLSYRAGSVLSNSDLKFETNNDSAYVDIEKIHTWDSASNYIQSISATYADVSNVVQSNSSQWGQGDPEVNALVHTNSGTWNTVSDKLDTSSFSDVSGTFLTAVNIPESANWNDATTAYQTNSASYLTSHQPISAEEWNDCYDNVNTNSGAWGGSALPISAGPGINLEMNNGVLVASVSSEWVDITTACTLGSYAGGLTVYANPAARICWLAGAFSPSNTGVFLTVPVEYKWLRYFEAANNAGHYLDFNITGDGNVARVRDGAGTYWSQTIMWGY
jgi:hypothetical protein